MTYALRRRPYLPTRVGTSTRVVPYAWWRDVKSTSDRAYIMLLRAKTGQHTHRASVSKGAQSGRSICGPYVTADGVGRREEVDRMEKGIKDREAHRASGKQPKTRINAPFIPRASECVQLAMAFAAGALSLVSKPAIVHVHRRARSARRRGKVATITVAVYCSKLAMLAAGTSVRCAGGYTRPWARSCPRPHHSSSATGLVRACCRRG